MPISCKLVVCKGYDLEGLDQHKSLEVFDGYCAKCWHDMYWEDMEWKLKTRRQSLSASLPYLRGLRKIVNKKEEAEDKE